ncbi:hypothetical protein [Colwellia psychrerythraea]|uniref:Lipoprotein n=1 Tax=Colwellia psychrerythraea TaxID=28229 RepID=A0A099KWZ8_COLPS|nr:hypothetical protein [Colwellia psychrerythraea]KGJ94158.1 hypothetical protein ND2E_2091 [Colwellia psychrerythraea]
MSQSIKSIQVMLMLLLIMATSACSALSTEEKKENLTTHDNSLEVIYGFDVKTDGLWFLVKSNGCTSKKNFNLTVKRIDNDTAQASLFRTKRDLCRGLPRLVSIKMPINDSNITGKHFTARNPFSHKPVSKKKKM